MLKVVHAAAVEFTSHIQALGDACMHQREMLEAESVCRAKASTSTGQVCQQLQNEELAAAGDDFW